MLAGRGGGRSTRPVPERLEQLRARHQSLRLTHQAQQQGALLTGETDNLSIIAPGRQHIALEGEIVITNQKSPDKFVSLTDPRPLAGVGHDRMVGAVGERVFPLRQKNVAIGLNQTVVRD